MFSGASLRSGTMRNGIAYPQAPLALTTKGIASGLLPTPTTQEVEHPNMVLTKTGRRLSKNGKTSHSVGLADAVRLFQTPTSSEHKYRLKGDTQASKCLEAQARRGELQSGIPGALNPQFVEWLMGFPIGHTELNNSATP